MNVASLKTMAIIRLPQTKGEIEAAAAEIVYTARHDRWTTDCEGKHFGTSRVTKENEVVSDCIIEAWLTRSARMGAMEKKSLAINMELTLAPWSEDVRRLGAKRVVTILSRSRWRGALVADHFLAARR